MNIYQIKKAVNNKVNFLSTETLNTFNQTLEMFTVSEIKKGFYFLECALIGSNGKNLGTSKFIYNVEKNNFQYNLKK